MLIMIGRYTDLPALRYWRPKIQGQTIWDYTWLSGSYITYKRDSSERSIETCAASRFSVLFFFSYNRAAFQRSTKEKRRRDPSFSHKCLVICTARSCILWIPGRVFILFPGFLIIFFFRQGDRFVFPLGLLFLTKFWHKLLHTTARHHLCTREYII